MFIKLNFWKTHIGRILLCLLSVSGLLNRLSAQSDERLINTGSGLSDETVRALYLHPGGVLYIGTSVGLSVFDGENIVNISTGLQQEVKNIIPWGKDSLILVRDNAISVININNYGYREKDFHASQANKIIYAVKAEKELYCATNEGLVKIDVAGLNYVNLSAEYKDFPGELVYPSVKCIVYSRHSGLVYIGHRKGLIIWDVAGRKLLNNPDLSAFNGQKIRDLLSVGEKLFFIADDGYLTEYNEQDRRLVRHSIRPTRYISDGDRFYFLSANTIYDYVPGKGIVDSTATGRKLNVFEFIRNNKGEFAVAGRSGLLLVKKAGLAVTQTNISELSSERKYLELQRRIPFGRRWYFNRRNGITELDTVTGVSLFHRIPADLVGEMLNIIPYRSHQLIVTGYKGYCGFDLKTGKYYRLKLFSAKMDSLISGLRIITGNYDSITGHLLLCPYRHPVIIRDMRTGAESTWNGNDRKWFRTVRSVHYFGNYEYLFGANGNDGLIRINLKTGNGRHYPPSAFSKAGNNSAIINQILPFNGVFYLATVDGLVRFEPESGKLTSVKLDGNPYHDQIYAIAAINGQLFATARNSLCKLTGDLDLVRLYTYENEAGAGIPFSLRNEVRFYVSDKLISMRIPDWSDTSFAYISHIGAGDAWQFVGNTSGCTVDYGSGSLQVLFGSKSFVRSQSPLVIRYRFSGNTDWQLLKGSSFQTGNLDYGVHEIEYFSIYLGKKSEVRRFVIVVRRPWWASYLFYAFCAVAVAFAVYGFLKWKLKQKDRREREQLTLILSASETERSRISREFHDGVGTRLSTVKLIAEGSRAGKNPALLEKLPEIVDEIIVDVRNIINELSPQSLKQYGLSFALKSHIRMLTVQSDNMEIMLQVSDDFPRLDDHAEINVFRICQELIMNAIKHSGGTRLNLALRASEGFLYLNITDNGKGMPREPVSVGHGLGNVKSRVMAMNGEISFTPAVSQGTEVKIVLPLRP